MGQKNGSYIDVYCLCIQINMNMSVNKITVVILKVSSSNLDKNLFLEFLNSSS